MSDIIPYIFLVLFIVVIFSIGAFGIFNLYNGFEPVKGWNFCKAMGYDGTTTFGQYSEYYGKVECVGCFKDNCTTKEFNVKRGAFGRIVLDEKRR